MDTIQQCDFGNNKFKFVDVRTLSKKGGTLQLRLNNLDGPIIGQLEIPRSNEWKDYQFIYIGISTGDS